MKYLTKSEIKLLVTVTIGLTENFEKVRKKIAKKIFVRKNQNFFQLHDVFFNFLVMIWSDCVTNSCETSFDTVLRPGRLRNSAEPMDKSKRPP